jgi:GNAT superfamily N-acetyltransferase
MLKYNEYIKENTVQNVNFESGIFETEHGEIRYRLYDDNVFLFMGSLVNKDYRGKGIFTEMLLQLIDKFKDRDIYVPISNKTIVNLFLRNGFVIYNHPIRYWGKPENAINMYRPASE